MLKKHPWSVLLSFVVMISALVTILSESKWKNEGGYAFSDAGGYYTYLPAAFIHHSFAFDTEQSLKHAGLKYTEDEKPFIKYTMGTAFCYTPGFIVAHAFASFFKLEADGYSLPYQIAFICTALFFLFLSLRLSIKILARYYQDTTIALTMLIVFLGSNYFHYATSYLSYSHIYSFYFILLFIDRCIQALEQLNWKNALYAGFAFGMMSLIRPVDAIFLLFPILYGVDSVKAFKKRITYLFGHIWQLLLAICTAVLIWIPQLIYNYSIFEKVTINTYKGEQFFFFDPELWNILFSFNNGWLIYTPLMIFGVFGCIYFLRKKEFSWLLISAVYIYVLSAWWCWWYVGFGNRAFVNLYALLLIPLAHFIAQLRKGKLTFYPFLVLLACGVGLNLFQTYQFEKDILRYEAMTFESYKHAWGKTGNSFEFYDLLEKYDTDYALAGKNVRHTWTYDTLAILTPEQFQDFYLSKEEMYKGDFKFFIPGTNAIRISAICDESLDGLSTYLRLIDTSNITKDEYGTAPASSYNTDQIKLNFYYRFRFNNIAPSDSFHLFLYNPDHLQGHIEELKIYALHAKDSLVFE
ncbi:hypothetical protein SAMN05216474_2803 [Lishizhenia tianjinensis]|uniref:Dolichyl-phosphate-mannose-protein mannosyltransferase n=1 Tax=Lishizhenia tianjinensis TaxID=477690 RepID=A0A1I7BG07_9FLAO|nr:hypothetical protein [Lishizhenia tianjinensis]SFT86110.1 hypothetical protein SAMN05216474_2803 [Lishizhenia tianjinensis]